MAGRFTLALVRIGAVRLSAVMLGGTAVCLAPLLSNAGLAQTAAAEENVVAQAGERINPSPPAVRRPDLEVGLRGGTVAELQAVLKLLGFYQEEVNGVYDEATSLAVVRFQAAAKLPQTGRVSTKTWNALFPLDSSSPTIATAPASTSQPAAAKPAVAQPPAPPSTPQPAAKPPSEKPKPAVAAKPEPARPEAAKPAPRPNPYPTLKLGQKGDAVARLQGLLKKKGFLDGQPDGAFGPMTEAAVKAAQEELDLEVDGVVGPATWAALRK